MKRCQAKRTIYIRTFLSFFTIYLLLMMGISILLLEQQKTVASLETSSYSLFASQSVERIIEDSIEENAGTADLTKVKRKLIGSMINPPILKSEMAVYTGDYELISHSNDYWVCVFNERAEGSKYYSAYGYINPKEWFNEKQIEELNYYINAAPKATKAGDLSGYSVDIKGFWRDEEMIIPEKIDVTAMYASSFNEQGYVKDSSGGSRGDIVYSSNYLNKKGLPYFEYGSIIPRYPNNIMKEFDNRFTKQAKHRDIVTNKDRLKEAVTGGKFGLDLQRTGLFTYSYYIVYPYKSSIQYINDMYHSDYWTVSAGEFNLLDKSARTLGSVWAGCLVIFMAAGFILSVQTIKTYSKREELEKLRSYTTNALAHDLKTPLSIISGYTQNLIENIHTDKREYYAESILSNVNRMDGIIREMLDLSKLEAPSFELIMEKISLGRVAYDLRERYEGINNEKRITCLIEGDVTVSADKALIERVLDNFYINALDNTPEGGYIHISIAEGILEFFNSGSQIPEDMINEIWLPFKKVDSARNKKGTGLGLSIARTILELHNFSYGAKNTEDGVIFWFRFD